MTGEDRSTSGLAPGFLVASPALNDPNFRSSLVLMAEHSPEGAFGLVVNRPSPLSVRDLLTTVGEDLGQAATRTGRDGGLVLIGGPVDPERLWILHRPGAAPPAEDGELLAPGVALGGSRALLETLVRDRESGPFLLLLGYAGWGPLQLEAEVTQGSWIPLALEGDLALDLPLEERWEEAVRRLGLEPAGLVSGGGAQA
ncbi:MAG TPA: YqgE/AlgH family protein [Anaeromyxobacteraceae bacterium]|nr:YqgE/AlgH family protein [Anaeromyxobacteraceae bacterium]